MRFTAGLEHLREMLWFIRQQALQAGLERSQARRLELAAEEALVNIMHHAYASGEPGELDLSVHSEQGDALKLEIRDFGNPYNPLEAEVNVDRDASLEDRPVGGLGLFMIQQFTDEVCYRREAEMNILTLVVHRD